MDAAGPSGLRVALGPGGEFDLIRRFLMHGGTPSPSVLVGPGDDAAVLSDGWVLTTDLTVEGVHFRPEWISDREVGYRAAAAALSDLAAMAAEAVGALVSMAVPRGRRVDAEAVQAGAWEAVAAVGGTIIGGDLSRSPGPLVVDVVVLGRTERPILRAGASPGDELWVTGALGASAAAVWSWERGEEPIPELREAFARPRPRLAAARRLVEACDVHALIDLSDGLAGDAGHIAAAGGVRLVLDPARVPVAPGAERACGPDEARSLALHGGEDYELLFAAAPGSVDADDLSRLAAVSLTRVGRVDEGEGVWMLVDGAERPVERGGYSHFDAEDA